MRPVLWGLAALAVGVAAAPADEPVWVFVSGDLNGYLSPCGCVKPMSGGIRRRATAIRSIAGNREAVVIETGPITSGIGRQTDMKAESFAEAFREMGGSAIAWTAADAEKGDALLEAVSRLSGGITIASGVTQPTPHIKPAVEDGPFRICSVAADTRDLERALGAKVLDAQAAIEAEAVKARNNLAKLIVLFDGSDVQALKLKPVADVRLIVHRGPVQSGLRPKASGGAWLIPRGELGKKLIALRWQDEQWKELRVIDLGPQYADDPRVATLYRDYQDRVRREKLLDQTPRKETEAFAGTKNCLKCHAEEGDIWAASKHAVALRTLEKLNSDADPECVGCHVVGLDSTKGFRSRTQTPLLPNVGCESCHGPGARHSADPKASQMGKVGPKSCLPCHDANNSPNFDFAKYWPKIAH